MKGITRSKKLQSKGDRLHWAPSKDAKPVKLTADMLVGESLSSFKDGNKKSDNKTLLVP